MKRNATGRVGGALPDLAVRLGEILVLSVLAWGCARLIWTVVTPAGRFGPPAAMAIAPAPAAADLARFDPFFRAAPAAVSAVSTLPLTLLGTRVDRVSGRGSAIIALPDGQQSSYLVGEAVLPGVVLAAVGFDAVTLDRGGAREQLFLDQSAPAPAPAAGGVMDAAPVAPAPRPGAGPAPRLGADLSMTPRLRGTAITGLVLSPRGSGAAFAAAGLQPGDVLVAVDGTPVAAIGDPGALARRLDANGGSVSLERGGRTLTIAIPAQGSAR